MAFKTQLMCFSYSCSTQSEELTQRVKYSNKILLPPSILQQLNDNDNISNDILFFKIINDKNQFHQICGVQEFSAPPGVVYSPYHVMEGLGIDQGDTITIELACPPNGSYIKLQPHKTEFINLYDPKAILEKVLSKDYPVVTEGHSIAVYYKELDRVFYIDIVKTEPASVIKIVNVNVNVDFAPPLDYVPPPPEIKYDKEKFPGKGHTLGSK